MRLRILPILLLLSYGFLVSQASGAAPDPSPSPSPSQDDCELGPGKYFSFNCPYLSLLMEHCYTCYHPEGLEYMYCDGWDLATIRDQCEAPDQLGGYGCMIEDVTPFHNTDAGLCPVLPPSLPINVKASTEGKVTVDVFQFFVEKPLSWMAIDCIDPNATDTDGDPTGSQPGNPTCNDCCSTEESMLPLTHATRTCMCKDGFAMVAVYIHDSAVDGAYGPISPPIPGHCGAPQSPGNGCRFVYKIPCGCDAPTYDMGEYTNVNVLKPKTTITIQPDGSKRIQQTLNEEFDPQHPQGGRVTYTRLVTDITIDPKINHVVDISEYVDIDVVFCHRQDEDEFVLLEIDENHELVDLLDPSQYPSVNVTVTAHALWRCLDEIIFRRVYDSQYVVNNENRGFLVLLTESAQFHDVIKEGIIKLQTNDLQRDFLAEALSEREASGDPREDTPEDPPAEGTEDTSGPAVSGMKVQGKAVTRRKLHDIFSDIGNFLNDKVIQPAINVGEKLWDGVKYVGEKVWDGVKWVSEKIYEAGKLFLTGNADVSERLKLIDISIDKTAKFTIRTNSPDVGGGAVAAAINVDITAKCELLFEVILDVEISGYSLKRAELAVAGNAELKADAKFKGSFAGRKTMQLHKFSFKSFTFMIGPVPIVITPSIPIEVGADLNLVGAVTAHFWVEAGAYAKWGFLYENGVFSEIKDYVPKFNGGQEISADLKFNAFLYIRPVINIDINLILGFSLGVRLGPSVDVDPTSCEVDSSKAQTVLGVDFYLKEVASLDVRLGFDLKILKLKTTWIFELFKFQQKLFDFTLGPFTIPNLTPGLLPKCEADGSVPGITPKPPTPIGRHFVVRANGKRCAGQDGLRVDTTQPNEEACFEHCKAILGCDKCKNFAYATATKLCQFSENPNFSCYPEPWDGFVRYEASGPCPGDCKNPVTAIVGQSWHSNTKTVHVPGVKSCKSPCGQGCRLNKDLSHRRDTFESVISDDGHITVTRTDRSEGWGVSLELPCCLGEDCVEGPWTAWGPCSWTCNGGSRTRTRTPEKEPDGGAACGPSEETEACGTDPCPVDCVEGPWTAWGACSATCDGGSRERTRTPLLEPLFGGAACGPANEEEVCGTEACPAGNVCPRPSSGCQQSTDVYTSVDCDRDGILDHVCTTNVNARRSLVLSSEGCPSGWGSDSRLASECPDASHAGEYSVSYLGVSQSANMFIGCDNGATKPGIFVDRLHFTDVATQCSQSRDSEATMYILNTHGAGKYECLRRDGDTLKGSHYTQANNYYGAVEYRLVSRTTCGSAAVQLPGTPSKYIVASGWALPASFTVEARLFVRAGPRDPYWLSYAVSGNDNCFLSRPPGTLLQWITVHITYSAGTTTYYSNGEVDDTLRYGSGYCGGGSGGALVLGQDQDRVGGGFQGHQSAAMDVAYLYIYSTAFESAKVAARAMLGAACPASSEPLAAAWVFDGAVPTQGTDISGNGPTLSVVGAPAYAPYSHLPTCASTAPSAKGAVQLIGTTSRYMIANPWSWPAAFTVEARIFVRPGSSDPYWLSYAVSSNTNCFLSRPPRTQLQWITVHITYSAGTTKFYSNGAPDDTLRWSGYCGRQGGALVLGQDQDRVGGGFQGRQAAVMDMAYLYIYSTAFDSAKVAARAALGAACPTSSEPLAAAWVFDGTVPTQGTDISGFGPTLGVVGTPLYVPYAQKPTCEPRAPDNYLVTLGKHCGGGTIASLEDGTPYGWAPEAGGLAACKAKCTNSASCSAFVWRSDSKCFWKAGVTGSTLSTLTGHDCYRKGAAQAQACPAFNPPTGTGSCSCDYTQGTCSCSCAAGYSGSLSATCTNGQWSYVSCTAVTCPAVSPPTGTLCSGCSNSYQGTCSCSCDTGAGYGGSPSATCGSNGQWSYVSCTAVTCPAVSPPTGTRCSGCSNSYQGTCSCSCDTGYSGSPAATCGSNGKWSYVSCTADVTAVSITGACQDGMNTEYQPQAVTASGRWWFRSRSGLALYWDKDCDGSGGPSRWIVDDASTVVSATAANDLDQTGACRYVARLISNAQLPPSGTWHVACDGAFTANSLVVSTGSDCARPSGCDASNEVYTSVDCDGDGILDHMCTTTTNANRWLVLSSEGCPSGWGSSSRPESECPAALAVSITGGCHSYFDTKFEPQAVTASGRWWYKATNGLTLYWDPDCDGTGTPSRWIIDNVDTISTTAANALDGTNKCSYLARSELDSTAQSPPSGTWRMVCDGAFTDVSLVLSTGP